MKTKASAILLMFICTGLTSFAQIFYKKGAAFLAFDFMKLITNYNIIIGLFLYMIGAIIMIIALKGGEVSVLYPIIATSYIWVSLLSIFFFNDNMNPYRWAGVFSILFGVSFIGLGGK